MLQIEKLKVQTEGKDILKGLNLEVKPGEIHAIMGPNGAGKSTLAKVLAGHPSYETSEGEIFFKGQVLSELDPDERAHLGLFVSFQYPIEIAGVSNFQFLFAAYKTKDPEISEEAFRQKLESLARKMQIKTDFLDRDINSGFSGGEKKRNEILQMAILNPDLAILDETDSGLDIDALKIVAEGVNAFMEDSTKGLVLITHYQRLLDYVKPDKVHVLIDGKIVHSGGRELALTLEEKGYDWLLEANPV